MEMNTAEVRMGELGKDFAQMVVRDHNQSLDKIKQLMADRGVKDTGNVKLTPEDQRTYDRLSKLSGANFDREFMATMVSAIATPFVSVKLKVGRTETRRQRTSKPIRTLPTARSRLRRIKSTRVRT